jgi:dipeptidyl aminopeptidase/acylaminoacyl peptidase
VGPEGTSFDAGGEVSSLAVSPDGKTVAYSRASGPASPDYPDMRCSARALVLRDLVSGDERTWASGEGSVSTIAWSADGTRLGFIEHPCCGDDDPLAFVVDAAAAPSGLDQLPPVVNPASDRGYCTTRAVVFVDDHVLLGHECASPTGTSDSVLVDASSGDLVATLPQSATGICVDRSGRHLLVEGHVPGSAPGTRALFSVDTESKTSRLLYDALSGGAW